MKTLISKLSGLFFLILLAGIPAYSQSAPAQEEGRRLINELMERDQIPGLSVTISKDGEFVWSEGFGFTDLEQEVSVIPGKSKFRIGSVSKPLTAMALAILYENGSIDLDVAIQKYIPDYPHPLKSDTFTLRQLAGHLAGIRHYKNDEFLSGKHYTNVLDGLTIFQDDPLINKPGTEYSYSSYGWNLISAAIEISSEIPFLEYMDSNVFDAMGMEQTYADQVYEIIPGRVRFYAIRDGEVINAPFVDNSYKWAGGGFISTSEDLARFGNVLLTNGLINEQTKSEFLKSQITDDGKKTNYGMGFRTATDKNGNFWYGHSGGSVGGITMFVVYPDQRMVVTIVTNSSNVRYGSIPFDLASLFMD